LGEAASLSSNTSHRLEGKGKSVETNEDRSSTRDQPPPPDMKALWDRYLLMERALLANGIDITAYSNFDPGASTLA